MRWKTTLILLTATIGIGAYISLYEIRQPSPEEREHRAKRVLAVDPSTVTALTLDLPQAKVALTRNGDVWTLAPKGLRADTELIDRIMSSLSPLESERVLSPSSDHPIDPKAYGLEPPVGTLSLTANGISTTLFFGETTAVQNNRYLKVASRPEIFVISSELFETANVPTQTFRDPMVLRFNSWETNQLSVASDRTAFTLTREENAWRLSQPIADQADRAQVTTLLNTLSGIRIARFVEDEPPAERLAESGLDQPKTQLTFQQAGVSAPTTLLFGKPLPDDASRLYAKRSDEPALYAVAQADLDPLLVDVASLRSKACLEFFTSGVVKVELAGEGGGALTIERKDVSTTSGQQPIGAPWYWQEAASGKVLDTGMVEAFLNKLAELRLVDFVEDATTDLSRYGLEPAAGTISVWTVGGEEPQRMLVGAAIEGAEERYGRLERRSAVVKLPVSVNDLLRTPLDEFIPSTAPAE